MKKIIIRVILGGFALGLCGVLLLTLMFIYFSFGLPKISTLADYKPAIPSQILSKDGVVLAEIGKEKREIAQYDEIPQIIVDSFLSAEDDNFFNHEGVDYLGIARAMKANILAGKVVQGGSTITQQVAKSLLLTRERSIARKVKDFLLAQRIEEKFTKKEILFLYLNQVYLGGGYYGVKSAFRGYFGKELSEASVAESAIVAGLLVAPGRYSPYIKPKAAKMRQRYVLGRLLANKKISKAQYDEAISEKIKYRLRQENPFKAGHFTDWVRQRIESKVGKDDLLTGGYKVLTTLDYSLQKRAEEEVLKGVKAIDKRQGFKGPIGKVDLETLTETYVIPLRKKIYKDNSLFFTLDDELKRKYEVEFDETELEEIDLLAEEFRKEVRSNIYRVGNVKTDKLLSYINKNDNHEAVVDYVDDVGRMIYISIGGVKGIIPYKYFRWAHERVISTDRQYFPYVTKPSSILSPGDKILVRVMNLSTSVTGHFHKPRRESLEKKKYKDIVKKQRFVLCMLDQDAEAQAALVSINPDTGELISMVGGAEFKKSQFNRAIQSRRQPGSSFKPLLFAAGLENGYQPNTIIIDSPEALGGVDSSINWKPRNYDGKFKGPITFRNSLEQSRNIPTIKIAERIGVPTILEFSERIGFNAKLDPDLSLSLGSFGVTLMDIVKTYAIFPSGGKLVNVKSIVSVTDRDNRLLEFNENEIKEEEVEEKTEEETQSIQDQLNEDIENPDLEQKVNPYLIGLSEDQVYDSRLAYIMTNLLKGVVLHGTGRGAKSISPFLGGKTGTTNNYVDAWFLGFSANVVTGVWTGLDDNNTMGFGETGAKSALPIWKGFMSQALEKYGEKDFSQPLGVVNVPINKDTGRLAKTGDPKYFLEAFVEGTEPGSETESLDETDQSGQLLEEDDYFENQ